MNWTRVIAAIGSRRIGKFFIPQIFKDLLKENSETHKKLGEVPLLIRIGEKNVTRDEYISALKKMYGLYVILEPKLEQAINWREIGINFNERRRLPWLERDLQKFGIGKDELVQISVCKEPLELKTLSEVLGSMAVVEGSSAGATATAQKLSESNLKLTAQNGSAFFNNYGERRNEMRMSFAQVVTTQNINRDEFLAGGKKTFDLFYGWLSG